MQTLTTTIKRLWLKEIIAGRKKVEYREIKPYWNLRLHPSNSGRFIAPFKMRMINGMDKKAPEVTVLIRKVDIGLQTDRATLRASDDLYEGHVYRLHIAKVLSYKNWDKKRGIPS
jgi:hypothetical protein